MEIIIFVIGAIVGFGISLIINNNILGLDISESKDSKSTIKADILIIITTAAVFLISFLKFGFHMMLLKAVSFDIILVITSFLDYKYRIIPNKIVFMTLILGGAFLFTGEVSLMNGGLAMLLGGGILFIIALIPGAMGGGDVKLMSALGLFLGLRKSLLAIFIAFFLSAVISIFLLVFKLKGRRDYIPFGPFIAIGSYLAFHYFIQI